VVNVYAKYTQLMEIELKSTSTFRFRVLMLVHQYHRASISRITEYAVSKMPTVTKIVGRLRDDGLLTTTSAPAMVGSPKRNSPRRPGKGRRGQSTESKSVRPGI
jgi:predicted transcriptional regulator